MPPPDPSSSPGPALIIRQEERADAATDLERSVELLRGVATGTIAEPRVVRVYTPAPTVALSRRESRLPGFETARRLRQTPGLEQPLLVAMTGYGQDSARGRAREAGFDEYLVKPVVPENLRTLARRRRPESEAPPRT